MSATCICLTYFMIQAGTTYLTIYQLLLSVVVQLFIYCYQGDRIIVESSKIPNAAYSTNWFTYSRDEQKIIYLLIMKSQTDYVISAPGFLNLSIRSFMVVSLEFCLNEKFDADHFIFFKVMKSSVSFCAILQSLDY